MSFWKILSNNFWCNFAGQKPASCSAYALWYLYLLKGWRLVRPGQVLGKGRPTVQPMRRYLHLLDGRGLVRHGQVLGKRPASCSAYGTCTFLTVEGWSGLARCWAKAGHRSRMSRPPQNLRRCSPFIPQELKNQPYVRIPATNQDRNPTSQNFSNISAYFTIITVQCVNTFTHVNTSSRW